LHGIGIQIDQLELQLGGFAEQVLQALRVLQPRHLDDDAVIALADDRWLARAEFVDPLAHHFGCIAHRGIDCLGQPRFGLGQHETLAVNDFDIPVTLASEAGTIGERQQAFARFIDLGNIAQQEA